MRRILTKFLWLVYPLLNRWKLFWLYRHVWLPIFNWINPPAKVKLGWKYYGGYGKLVEDRVIRCDEEEGV